MPAAELPSPPSGSTSPTPATSPASSRATAGPLGRRLEPQARPLEYLQPGATREFHLEIAVLDGAEEITSRRVTGTRLLISSYFLGRAVAAM